MKRLFSGVLSIFMMLSAAACSSGNTAAGNAIAATSDANTQGVAEVLYTDNDQDLQGEITVSIFNPMPSQTFLQDAAGKFEALHPNTKVNITAFAAMPEIKTSQSSNGQVSAMMISDGSDTDVQMADYINQINTQLMSGQGPDLFGIDVLPYYRYATSGQLEDLSLSMNTDSSLNPSDYRQNIFDAVKIDGKQYFIPLDYNFNLMGYDPTLFTDEQLAVLKSKDKMTIEEMVSFAESNFNSNDGDTLMFSLSGGVGKGFSMFNELLKEHYADFLNIPDKKASFNTGEFANLLTTVKDYEDKGYIRAGNIQQGPASGGQQAPNINAMIENRDASIYYKTMNNANLLNYLTKYYDKDKTSGLRNDIVVNGVSMKDTDEILGLITNDNGDVSFTSTQAYAMNANSSNKQLSWAFLRFLLSEDVQSSPMMTMGGIPVNIRAAEDKAKLQAGGVSSGIAIPGAQRIQPNAPQNSQEPPNGNGNTAPGNNGRPDQAQDGDARNPQNGMFMFQDPGDSQKSAADVTLTEDQQQVYDAYLSILEKYSAMINNFAITDETVTNIITSEARNFFTGTKSADEVANLIQNKADLYINE